MQLTEDDYGAIEEWITLYATLHQIAMNEPMNIRWAIVTKMNHQNRWDL